MKPTHRRAVVCGDFPDLEAAFTERVRELRRSDPLAPLVVLVPTNLLRQHLGRSLVTRGVPHLNVRFVTFATLVGDLVLPGMIAEGQSPLPAFAGELLMARTCEQLGAESYFHALSDRPGLHRSLLGTVQDLKEAGANVDSFDVARQRLAGLHATAQTKLASFASAWRRYEQLKSKHLFMDDADQHALAATLVEQHPKLVAAAELVVYGIYDFKRMQARLVLAIAEHVPTTVFFPCGPTPAWDYARPSLMLLETAGFVASDADRTKPSRCDSLDRLCDRLFDSCPASGVARTAGSLADSAVEIVSVPGETREAQEIPRIVLDLARSSGIKFSEVGIQLRSPASVASVRAAFDEVELPARCPSGVPLAETRAGRSLVLMLQVIDEDFARRDLMEFVTFADLDFESLAGTTEPPLALWDALSMRANIVRGREQWQRRLASLRDWLARQGDDARPRPEAEPRENNPRAADRTLDLARDPAVVDGLIQAVQRLFDPLEQIARSRDWVELVDCTAGAFEKLVRQSAERDDVLRLVAELRRLNALDPGADLGLLGRLVADALATERADGSRGAADGPVVTALMAARGVPFRAVIVPGLVERSFPQPASIDPILLDHEREQLNEAFASTTRLAARSKRGSGGPSALPPRLPEKSASALEERLLFRLAVGAASERVVLTFPRIESESGRERLPSYFLLRTLDALGISDRRDWASAAVESSRTADDAASAGPSAAGPSPAIDASLAREQASPVNVGRELKPPLNPPADGGKAFPPSAGELRVPPVGIEVPVAEGKALPPSAGGFRGGFSALVDVDIAAATDRARARRGRKPPAPNQLVMSFLAPPLKASAQRPAPSPPAAEFAAAPAAPFTPATYERLLKWPGRRHVRLFDPAADGRRATTLFEFDVAAALRSVRDRTPVLGAFGSISPHFARGVRAEAARWSPQLTRFDGLVEDPELLAQLRRQSPLEQPISPSRIEDYARCPFHFYMHNLLHLEDLEEPEELTRSDAAAKGRTVHKILEEFLSTMNQQGRLPLTADCEMDLFAIADRQLDEFEKSGAAGPVLIWQVEREQLAQFFRDFVRHEVEWQQEERYLPTHFEMKFGARHTGMPAGASDEPPRIDLGDGRVLRFHGFIDRVDVRESDRTIYVIDYKGRTMPKLGKDGIGSGTAVQLPIYSLAACDSLKQHGEYRAAGGCYLSYQPGIPLREIGGPTEESDARLRAVLRTIADGIHDGLFMQYTGSEACRYCAYDRVCMGVQEDVARRKEHDEAAAGFLDMKAEGRDEPFLKGSPRN